MSTDQIEVVNNTAESRFEATVDGQLAFAEYKLERERIIFPHTVVPPAIEGRGIASEIARVALEEARSKGLKVVPRCAFFADYITKNPQYGNLVKE